MSDTAATTTETIDRDALNRYVGRVLELHEQRASLNGDISEVYAEAKSAGFVTGIIRQIVREQKMEAEDRHTHYAVLDSYRHALGMLEDTPLGKAALATLEAEAIELGKTMRKPRPLAEQTIKRPASRRRKQQSLDELLDNARQHLGETAGTA